MNSCTDEDWEETMSFFKHVSLHCFRNYPTLQIDLSAGPVVLWGRNGSGKTNLLEALSLFALGTGFRGAKVSEFSYNPAQDETSSEKGKPWAVHALLDSGVTLATGQSSEGGSRRVCKIQGEPVRTASAFHAYVRLLPITPAMDHLFTAPSLERRHFVDRLVATFDPDHATHLVAYDKAMRQRLALLKGKERPDALWLSSLERIMAQNDVLITRARQALMQRLERGEGDHCPLFPRFSCRMIGQVEDVLEGVTGPEAEALLRDRLVQTRERDQAAGMTTLGCHRSDFEVTHTRHQRLARHCSTGEQKILLISILLAFVAQRGERTTDEEVFLALLLDDVVARLDDTHRMALFEQIALLTHSEKGRLPVQTFFTGTDRDLFDPLKDSSLGLSEALFLEVSRGTIRETR